MDVQDVLPPDAIPSIDDPVFGEVYFGDPDDDVIVVEGDPPRAYPVRILGSHEIVNDVVDGRPIAVTWCPICWSAVVYDRTVEVRRTAPDDGGVLDENDAERTVLTFGVSGKLADDALVMYDRETGSEWKQPTGIAIDGELDGTRLTALRAPLTSWERFAAERPDGVVLQPVRGTGDSSGSFPHDIYDMARYERYVESDEFGLYGMRGEGGRRSWDRDDLEAKTLVLGVEHGGEAVGYPVPRVETAGGVVTDIVGSLDVVVFATDDGPHVFEDPGFDFETRDGTVRADGTTWDPVTGGSADGRRLERVPGRQMFAFAWQDAHGPDTFYER